MSSIRNAQIVNETSNRLGYRLQDNENWYKLFLTIIPRNVYKKINYLKKTKKSKVSTLDQEKIDALAYNLEMSKKEVLNYLNLLKTKK
jgi:hypothetical protein